MFINPIRGGYLTSPFGHRTKPYTGFHQGIDIALQPNTNVPILASASGVVIRVGSLGTYGNIVIIRHLINNKYMETLYAHLANGSIKVEVNQIVKQGEQIAIMGNTGQSTGPHLHFEIHDGRWMTDQPNAVDPRKYIDVYYKEETAKMLKEINSLKNEVASLKSTVDALVKLNNKTYTRTIPSGWATKYIEQAKLLKITDGTRLDALITREEAIVLVMNSRNIKE